MNLLIDNLFKKSKCYGKFALGNGMFDKHQYRKKYIKSNKLAYFFFF